jgi:hypothetical protein
LSRIRGLLDDVQDNFASNINVSTEFPVRQNSLRDLHTNAMRSGFRATHHDGTGIAGRDDVLRYRRGTLGRAGHQKPPGRVRIGQEMTPPLGKVLRQFHVASVASPVSVPTSN